MITIDEQGIASSLCMYARPGMLTRRLGQYCFDFTTQDIRIRRIYQFIKEHHLYENCVVTFPRAAGSRIKSFSIKHGTNWIINSLPASAIPPFPLDELERMIEEIIKETNKYPLRALNFETKLNSNSFKPGNTVNVDLILSNIGSFPLNVSNPASSKEKGGGDLLFLVWNVKNLGSESEQNAYHATIDTSRMEFIKNPYETISSLSPYLRILPEEKLRASLSFLFPKYDPGIYKFQLVFNSSGNTKKDHELITGLYHGDSVSISVIH